MLCHYLLSNWFIAIADIVLSGAKSTDAVMTAAISLDKMMQQRGHLKLLTSVIYGIRYRQHPRLNKVLWFNT
jgi:hypothetical protein